ncbi:MAG: PAS domain S-box protein, partial [Vicinamibacteria bacterium]
MTPDRSDSRPGFLETDLARVLDASPLSLVVLQGGRLVFANARSLRSLGLTLESALGSDPSLAIIDEGARERARDRARRAEGGEPQPPIVYQTLRADGKRVWARIESTPCVFGGKPASLSVAQDATDEVEASLGLRDSEERYRRLFEDSPLAMAISRDGTLLLANPALARLAGAPSTEVLAGFSLLHFVEPAVRDATLMRLMDVQGGGDVPQVSRRIRNLQGREIQIEVISKPFVHEGEPAVLTLVIDATARNVAELRAQQSDAKYRHLLESSPNALVVTRDRRILLANSTFARFTGVPSPDALIGRNLVDFAPPQDRTETEARLKAVDLGERAPWLEAEVLKADGTVHPVEAQSEPFEYEGVRAILTIMRDISDRKAMEATRREEGAAARE